MRVYLDTCCYQRPFDDKSLPRIKREAEAVLFILDLVNSGQIELVSSDVLRFEAERNRNRKRSEFGVGSLEVATVHIELAQSIVSRSLTLNQSGIRSLDAMHLAFAEAGRVALFCTCDDELSRKARREILGGTRVVTPIELTEILSDVYPGSNPE
ncbi:MAG: hypothetical protein BMS9Abin05_0995 [Rhodothermia bacterium]|nr:MAG: hypothetical protein BMS9Abin05_0995 [Rhodothermia bacterium]